jgi:uncharacterized glyoxalase superfamily protein PhnB
MSIDQVNVRYAQAVEADAGIVIAIKHENYSGRSYSCLDPEGHIWNFGSYDPWSI